MLRMTSAEYTPGSIALAHVASTTGAVRRRGAPLLRAGPEGEHQHVMPGVGNEVHKMNPDARPQCARRGGLRYNPRKNLDRRRPIAQADTEH